MNNPAQKILLLLIGLVTACAQPKQDPPKNWWKETVFYEIYMPSYKDSDGDGYSDFKGLTSKLDYIQDLGVKGIWLTPFLKSPKVDNGYDVADYRMVDPSYGNLDDFKVFMKEAHKRDIKVIMDMVVNHTSTDSYWFQESRKSKDNPYRDYYIWKDQPNNWESFFGGTAWEYDSLTQQYYYHQFDVKMADLNWENPQVVTEIQNMLRFWLDMGVDGFRMDVINFLTTDGITQENPVNEKGEVEHLYDKDQAGVKEAMRTIKATINEYEDRFIVGEVGSDKIDELKMYQSPDLLDVVFNFNFGSIPEFSAERIYQEMVSMEENMTSYPTLFFGSHDMPRLMSRLAEDNPKRAEALAVLMFTAKGVPFIYFGEEIGMESITANTLEEMKDVQGHTHYQLALKEGKSKEEALKIGNDHNRDKSRSPMQWNDQEHAGFSDQQTWIKVHENFKDCNVKNQLQDDHSMLEQYKKLIYLRNTEAVLQYGKYESLAFDDERISYTRSFEGEKISVVINFGEESEMDIPEEATLLFGDTILKKDEYLIYKH